MSFSRRALLKASAASAVLGGIGAPLVARAQTAEFTYKYANNLARRPSDERPRQGDGGGDQGGDQWPGRPPDFPEQPARLRHRHAEPAPLRRHRVLHPVRPDPVDPGAGGLDQRHRLRLHGLRHGLEGDGRRARRLRARRDRQGRSRRHGEDLGQRLPPDHVLDQADQRPRRLQGLQDPRAGVAAVDLDVQGVRRLADLDQFQRGLFRAADQDRRGPGKSAGADLDRQALRGAEILLADQPHVGRLLVPGQPPRLGGAAAGPARRSSPRTSTPRRSRSATTSPS